MGDVAVGSQNPTKVGAAKTVFDRLGLSDVLALAVPSGVPEQPIGLEETRVGAINRARSARAQTGARYGVGLEGGAELLPDGTAWLIGVAVIADETRLLTAVGPRLWLPPKAAEALRAGEELGPIIDRLSGMAEAKTGIGAIGWLTDNLVERQASWVVTLACAAAPLFHPDLYPPPSR
jgi:inosine/xanthosine triphosphatase